MIWGIIPRKIESWATSLKLPHPICVVFQFNLIVLIHIEWPNIDFGIAFDFIQFIEFQTINIDIPRVIDVVWLNIDFGIFIFKGKVMQIWKSPHIFKFPQ